MCAFNYFSGTAVLALAASAYTKNSGVVTKLLHMETATQVIVSPNRTNNRLGLSRVPTHNLYCMDWKEVKEKGLLLFIADHDGQLEKCSAVLQHH